MHQGLILLKKEEVWYMFTCLVGVKPWDPTS